MDPQRDDDELLRTERSAALLRALHGEGLSRRDRRSLERTTGKRFQRLEFLGDRVVELLVALDAFHHGDDVADAVSARTTNLHLAEVAQRHGLIDGVDAPPGPSRAANTMEATMGGVYRAGGAYAALRLATAMDLVSDRHRWAYSPLEWPAEAREFADQRAVALPALVGAASPRLASHLLALGCAALELYAAELAFMTFPGDRVGTLAVSVSRQLARRRLRGALDDGVRPPGQSVRALRIVVGGLTATAPHDARALALRVVGRPDPILSTTS